MKSKSNTRLPARLIATLLISIGALVGCVGDPSIIPQSKWMYLNELLPDGTIWPAWGDFDAGYGVVMITKDSGSYDILKIEGTFPKARYLGFSAYSFPSFSQSITDLKDIDIETTGDNVNPFIPGNDRSAPQQDYTLYLVKEGVTAPPGLENVITIPTDTSTDTQMLVGIRAYRSDNGVPMVNNIKPFPVVTALYADLTPGIAPEAIVGVGGETFANYDFDVLDAWWDAHKAFSENNGDPKSVDFLQYTGSGYGPNPNNSYATAALDEDHINSVAVINVPRAATYEDSQDGAPFIGGTDVRYWSFCVGESGGSMTNTCKSDDACATNDDGSVTLVIAPDSLQGDIEAAGLNFMPWSIDRTPYETLLNFLFRDNPTFDFSRLGKKPILIYRQLIADPSWPGAIGPNLPIFDLVLDGFDPTPADTAEAILGDDGPRGFIVDIPTFLTGLANGDYDQAL